MYDVISKQIAELRLELAKGSYQQSKLIISSRDKLEAQLLIINEKLDTLIKKYDSNNSEREGA